MTRYDYLRCLKTSYLEAALEQAARPLDGWVYSPAGWAIESNKPSMPGDQAWEEALALFDQWLDGGAK